MLLQERPRIVRRGERSNVPIGDNTNLVALQGLASFKVSGNI